MRHIKALLIVASAWTWLPGESPAQLVEVGPGYVKAPFVRVYRNPGGGGYVRAPFVSRNTPGFRGNYSARPTPAEETLGLLSWAELSQRVRVNCEQLENDLSRFPSGQFWKNSLKTAEITGLIAVGDAPPTDEVRSQLAEILGTFNSIGNAPDFNRVAQLESFRDLRAAMSEYVASPELRSRQQLSIIANDLRQELSRFKTGAGWQDYLLLSSDMPLSVDRLRQSEPTTSDLADALVRYDSASQNPEFGTITELPGFKAMHGRLYAYFGERQADPLSSAEELPAPTPARR